MTVVVELYGRLRAHGDSVSLELREGATAGEALAALAARLGALAGVALAGEAAVLAPSDPLPRGRIAALPPVCGG